MAHEVCKRCKFSAVCIIDGFHHVFGKMFQKQLPRSYRPAVMRVKDDGTSSAMSVERVRISTDMAATQVAREFPEACPYGPSCLIPRVSITPSPMHVMLHVTATIGDQLYGVNLV